MLEVETYLWAANELLITASRHGNGGGAWHNQITEAINVVRGIAGEMHTYNDQFEEDE